MPLFLENPPGGGGSGQDRFAPKYIVGNTLNGDSATAYSTDGFYYIPDPGDGTGIATALAYATSGDPDFVALGDVWIRPGTYTVSQTLVVPVACTVRGSGPSTLITSVANSIPGALISLSDQSSLRDVALIHSNPADSGGTQFGVVDLRGGSLTVATAYCENVQIVTVAAAPANTTLFAGFSAGNFANGGFRVALSLRRCSVTYGLNTAGNTLGTFLCGYRSLNAALVMDECYATASQDGQNNLALGYSVVATSTSVNLGQSSLDVRGGRYVSWRVGICTWGQSGLVAPASIVGTEILGSGDPNATTSDSCVYQLGRGRLAISNCDFLAIGAGTAVTLNPAGQSANCTGQIHGNTLRSDTGKAWNSLESGYHTIIGNCYTNSTPPTSSPNDEVAHNIVI